MTDAAAEFDAPMARQGFCGPPRVSVVMPFHDAGPFIAEAIESVLAQSFAAFELLAIDDGSNDDSAAIAARYAERDTRVRLISEGRQGFVPSLNRGIALARGEFIARMDADDVCMPDRLAKQVAFLDRHPNVGAVGGQIFALLDGKTLTPPWWVDNPLDHASIVQAQRHRNCLYHPTALIRAADLTAVGGYRPAFAVVQDYDLWLRLSERVRLANLPDRVLRYRFHEGQATERRLELAYLCTWCARFAAAERRAGRADPIRSDTQIDRQQAIAWGLDERSIGDDVTWIKASHRARAHLLAGHRARAAAAFTALLLAHPLPFLRRALAEFRNRLARRRATERPEPTPAWPTSR